MLKREMSFLFSALALVSVLASLASADGPRPAPWTRVPGRHSTNRTPEATLQRVADLLQANDIDEMMKSFEPNNRNNRSFRGGSLDEHQRATLAAYFRGATLAKKGWWEESHGGVYDEYRLFKGVLYDTNANPRDFKIRMVKVNPCSMTVQMGLHDPGEWIIFDWQEAFSDPHVSFSENPFRAELPKDYRCPFSVPASSGRSQATH